ncbi:MAG: menaquinone biosynthesis decarboxylase, partial [Arcobacteraceae bacterium]
MKEAIKLLKEHDLLKVIDQELDIYLEIPHVAYVEVKRPDSKAILFTNVVDRKNNKRFDMPVLMNVFCNEKAVKLFIGDGDKIGREIESLLKMKPPTTFSEKLSTFGKLF